jgi:hypothetical protein
MFGYELKPSLITVVQALLLGIHAAQWQANLDASLTRLLVTSSALCLVDLGSDCRSQPPCERHTCSPWQGEWSVWVAA